MRAGSRDYWGTTKEDGAGEEAKDAHIPQEGDCIIGQRRSSSLVPVQRKGWRVWVAGREISQELRADKALWWAGWDVPQG